jgi:hypothetical protein
MSYAAQITGSSIAGARGSSAAQQADSDDEDFIYGRLQVHSDDEDAGERHAVHTHAHMACRMWQVLTLLRYPAHHAARGVPALWCKQ